MRRVGFLVFLFATAMVSFAWGDVQVGDKPELQFKAAGGENVSLAALHGKIVVIDFWATWCKPCMAEAPHMVEVNQKYADKGLQFLGVSLDNDVKSMLKVAKEKGFTWPQACDGGGWDSKFAKAWGVRGIPHTFIISPDGQVLWAGHPAMIDSALAKAFKEHPPQLVDPQVLADANKQLDAVAASLKDGNTVQAMKLMAAISPDAKKDGVFAQRSDAVSADLEASGQKMLAEVEPMITAGQYGQASARLVELFKSLPGTPIAAAAHKRLDDMQADPKAKAAIEADHRATGAAAELAIAQKLAADKKNELAYSRYKSIVKGYAGTPSADTAAAAIAEYERDPAFVKHVTQASAGDKARSLLSMAASYAGAGRTDMAKQKYQAVIDQFPGTSFADTAKTELAKLQ